MNKILPEDNSSAGDRDVIGTVGRGEGRKATGVARNGPSQGCWALGICPDLEAVEAASTKALGYETAR